MAEATIGWLRLVGHEVKEGVKSGELSPRADPRAVASVVATLEGAVMLSRLQGDPAHMQGAVRHLKDNLRSLARESEYDGTPHPDGELGGPGTRR